MADAQQEDPRQVLIGQILAQVAKNQITPEKALETINALLAEPGRTAPQSGPSIAELEERIRTLAVKAKRFA